MRRMQLFIMVLVCLLICPMVFAGGMGVVSQPDVHQEHGRVNIWATVIYQDAPRANLSFGADQCPDIVADPFGILHISWTTQSNNWKDARIGMPQGHEIPIRICGGNAGDVLSADIPLTEFQLGINGLCPVIGQKGSNQTIFLGIGKHGLYNTDWGLLRFNLVKPPFSEAFFQPMAELGLSAKEVYLLAFCGGEPVIGSVAKDLVRQITERMINQRRLVQTTPPPAPIGSDFPTATGCSPAVVPQTVGATAALPAPIPQISQRTTVPTAMAISTSRVDLSIKLTDLPQFTGSKHFQIELPSGVKSIRYSLTRTDRPEWKTTDVSSNHLRLEVPDGIWYFRVQAVASDGQLGPICERVFTEGGQ